jgi:hypothetical protein
MAVIPRTKKKLLEARFFMACLEARNETKDCPVRATEGSI